MKQGPLSRTAVAENLNKIAMAAIMDAAQPTFA